MNEYYKAITCITTVFALIMIIIVASDFHLDKKIKRGYILTYLCIIISCICEFISVFLNNKLICLVKLHYIVKFLEFAVTPIIPLIVSNSLRKIKGKEKCIATLLIITNIILEFASIFLGNVFYIDTNNVCYYSKGYNVYFLICVVAIFFMFYTSWKFSKQYQNKNEYILVMILIFIMSAIILRVIFPSVRVVWQVVAMSITFIYVYHNGLMYYIDGLTQLLNQRSFLNYTTSLKSSATIIIFDIDDFKSLNDSNGHQYGNECLINVAKVIKECYQKYGLCYRIGGDEFAVVINSEKLNLDKLNAKFKKMLQVNKNNLPKISMGHAVFNPEYDVITNVIDRADSNMYNNKRKND